MLCYCGKEYENEILHKSSAFHANYILKYLGCEPMEPQHNREYSKEYRMKNKEKLKEYYKNYHMKNKKK